MPDGAVVFVDNLPPYLAVLGDNPFQPFFSAPKVIPILNEWIAIKGTNEGEIQISGKVTNHGVIPDGDAIVTSPLKIKNCAFEPYRCEKILLVRVRV